MSNYRVDVQGKNEDFPSQPLKRYLKKIILQSSSYAAIEEESTEREDFENDLLLESPPSEATETYKDVNIDNNLSDPQKDEIRTSSRHLTNV